MCTPTCLNLFYQLSFSINFRFPFSIHFFSSIRLFSMGFTFEIRYSFHFLLCPPPFFLSVYMVDQFSFSIGSQHIALGGGKGTGKNYGLLGYAVSIFYQSTWLISFHFLLGQDILPRRRGWRNRGADKQGPKIQGSRKNGANKTRGPKPGGEKNRGQKSS